MEKPAAIVRYSVAFLNLVQFTMQMKNLVPFFIFLIVFSCKEISFKEPQPKGKKSLREVPERLLGTYLLEEEGQSSKDTLVVTRQGYLLVSDQ